ncbi:MULTISPECIES: polysaccharide biosynthesis protein [Paracoccaceae]|jgi:FlaA1/EpsC-like NDP-sugar epimerase|uniref:polysaccharide biosynthesis protein n=1 Tax=Rhodobacterales TaxID=204455 RepID=UPI001B20DCBF|nr:nucleoside-diphosphate sugar epimerase/dehydratase [Boseongicola sp. H5]MBO6601634.1 polysaccharide biosynthesis protein [Roseicyclus sp.]MBO6623466.1 polysaccharide biosynthesis protein [Roseicyclus sp.]MBO6920802.1 polysaccharide biosynthesis protein [Roseicyclus sp.]
MLNFVKSLTRREKKVTLLIVDVVLIPLALVFSFAVQAMPVPPLQTLEFVLPILPYLMALGAVISVLLGVPDIRVSAYEWRGVAKTMAFAIYLAIGAAVLSGLFSVDIPPSLHIDFGITFFLLSAASRVVMYQILLAIYRWDTKRCRVLIYGAGTTGMQLATALKSHETIDPVAFVDDNRALHGLLIAGLPVHAPVRIDTLVTELNVDRVLLAIPSLSQPKQARIARNLQDKGLEVQTLPSFSQLIGEEPLLERLTTLDAHSYLQRPQVTAELEEACGSYSGRSVLISGAGGSIGAELARQVLACAPSRLVLYELSELALYNIEMELRPLNKGSGVEIVPVLGSVTDARQVRQVIQENGVQVVLHAAAYKHVPLVELNPLAGLKNNVLGTHTLAREAADGRVERFVLISSDKAVRPTSVMGATKRIAELVVQDFASRHPETAFGIVRFGNVLGSSGSVVPLFQEQVNRGGPVTVTDPNVIRYFMTVREAVHLVLRAGAMARDGEVFLLEMGEPVSVWKLARQVIERAGYTVKDDETPDGDIEIVFTGLRNGEKLQEELTVSGTISATRHPKILFAQEPLLSEIEVASIIRGTREAIASGDARRARALVARWLKPPMPDEDTRGVGAS